MLGKEALSPNISDVLPNLQFLSLARNMFEGHIPTSLINASGLWLIDLTNNNFYGVSSTEEDAGKEDDEEQDSVEAKEEAPRRSKRNKHSNLKFYGPDWAV